jgi:phosphoesterase RecJ-like protein
MKLKSLTRHAPNSALMHNTKVLQSIVNKIKGAKRSVVISHSNPDGDTLGSMLALGSILKKLGHKVDHVAGDPVPEIYRFLPFNRLVKNPSDDTLKKSHDLAFSLDCGSLKRLGSARELWHRASSTVNIDHHVSNERFGEVNWIEPDAISTGQLVYWIAKALNIEITKELATLLYVTLLTDTGCFSNSNTNSQALSWGAELISLGADHKNVYRKVFMEKPFRAVKVFAIALSHLKLVQNGQIAWTCITKEEMKSLKASSEDTEDIIDYMMRTKGVKIGVFFREEDNETKVSLRSNVDLDVSRIAVSFGGGGHKRASGIKVKKPLSKVKDLVLSKVIHELNNGKG